MRERNRERWSLNLPLGSLCSKNKKGKDSTVKKEKENKLLYKLLYKREGNATENHYSTVKKEKETTNLSLNAP